ncbi:MAG: benzoate/H(+) symporter BenE family transporter [Hyphomicrobiales bacterium]
MQPSVIISALVAVFVGFAGSVAIVLEATKAVGATPEQTSSWIAALCVAMAVTTAILSIRHRMPIITAWSTPGAALIAASSGIAINAAVGAFLFAAVLILLTASIRPLSDLIGRIPTSIASAMLAGVLFSFVIALFPFMTQLPALVIPMVVAFVVLRLFSPVWAVLIVFALGIILSFALGLVGPPVPIHLTRFVWITPEFQASTLIGLGLPLYLVTMASQNLPGFAVLKASGYTPPSRSILAVTGGLSFLTAPFGAHTSNLAAITASICAGEDAHPNKAKRWLCGPFYAAGYAALAIAAASVVALFARFPSALIATIAGIALFAPFIASLTASVKDDAHRFAGVTTFLVTASGIQAFSIGSAFWGLLAGLIIFALDQTRAGT